MQHKSQISNWGNYPKVEAKIEQPAYISDVQKAVRDHNQLIARGNGRSYGDASLGRCVLSTRKLNKFLAFDTEMGIISCQAGVLLSEILEVITPKGFFLPVTPGTKFVTVGGAIAADVHGKNHHAEGCFSQHLISFELVDHEGELISCSPSENEGLFWQTVGGMGSTGVIVSATFYLKPIESVYIKQEALQARNLDEIMQFFAESESWTYTMAWIDCLQKGKNMGRSILLRGEHARREELPLKLRKEPLKFRKRLKLNIPFNFPGFVLNSLSIRVFNFLYYHKQLKKIRRGIVSYDPFFYPLDAINNWNRMYGKRGFTQHQFVLPKSTSREGLEEILTAISKSGHGSFLAVLKLFGDENPFAPNSFPKEGYTLALDFPIKKGLPALLAKLDALVLKHGGRLYLAKDAFMSKEMFAKTYPNFPKSAKFQSDQQIRLATPVKEKNTLAVKA